VVHFLGLLLRHEIRSDTQYLGNNRIDVCFLGQGIYDTDSKAESSLQFRVRKIDFPATHNSFEQCQVEKISHFLRRLFSNPVAEADCTQFHRTSKFKCRGALDCGCEALCVIEILLNCGAERVQPVIAQ
jgi:hypothetical protein